MNSTPHIEITDQNLISKKVLMPGDPLRAEYAAKKFLKDPIKVNSVRNMFAYTGTYKGEKVTIFGSGMGMPSIGIYSYELFSNYNVDTIIRIGSMGSYVEKLDIYDTLIVDNAYSESTFAKVAFGYKEDFIPGNKEVVEALKKASEALNVNSQVGTVHSSDVFYRHEGDVLKEVAERKKALGVEMESFALFANAKYLNKKAGCILTVSDSFVSNKKTTSEERQTSFNAMIEVALEALLLL